MANLTKGRIQEIADQLLNIRLQLELIKPEEIEEILRGMSQDEAIGPLLDPTKWRDQDLFTVNAKSQRFLEKLLELKAISSK